MLQAQSRMMMRWVIAVLLAVLVLSIGTAGAVTVVTVDGEEIAGALVLRDDEGVVLRLPEGTLRTIPAKYVKTVDDGLPRDRLERLTPDKPGDYFALGQELLPSKDPDVSGVGARLLRIAARLDPKQFYRKAYQALYRHTEGGEKFEYGSALLAYDPNDVALRAELQALAEKRQDVREQLSELLRGVRAWREGRTAAAMWRFRQITDDEVIAFAGRETGRDWRLIRSFALTTAKCPRCKGALAVTEEKTDGVGRVVCDECRGKGGTREGGECEKCRGFGSVPSSDSKGTGAVPCPTCGPLMKRLKLQPISPEAAADLNQRILARLIKGDPDLQSPSVLRKVPQAGTPVFVPDDYERIRWRDGQWVLP